MGEATMQGEIVAIGTELLLGQIIDTNSAYLAQQMASIGLNLYYKTVIGDNPERMKEVLTMAHQRSEIVVTTGGIGPTADDVTREVVAEVMGVELEFQPYLMEQIENIFKKSVFTMGPSNRKQAFIPRGSLAIENPRGTAPGFIVEDERGVIICLPGVPHEMKYLMENTVIPYLIKRSDFPGVIKYKSLKTSGIGESRVNDLISDLMESGENPTVGLLASLGQVRIRIAAKAPNEEDADRLIREMEEKVRSRVGEFIFGADEETLEDIVCQLLRKKGLTLAIAETSSGGHLCQMLTLAPHSSSCFQKGFVLHSLEAQNQFLGEQEGIWDGDHSEKAKKLAQMARAHGKTDLGLGVLGYIKAEDDLSSRGLPSTFIALADRSQSILKEYRFGWNLEGIQVRSSIMALDLLRRYLLEMNV
ncbi:MAG: competence/damage-inducible protein A, partial [Candidatus Tectomicrobia bacterium]|nr:competence/damage-inducible protein A [Candidatus Tectomicrobia bacterium]